jgi:uncharacterized protein YecE (DUF72 family)
MAVLVGTSGWQYRDWRGTFYPQKLPQSKWLEHYAGCFQVVEVNNAFYRLPEARTFTQWAERTPDDFVVGVKASRYLSHIKRLQDPAEPVARFMERARCLGPKLGPVLLQLPPTLRLELGRLDETLSLFPDDVRVAVELRHDSWFVDATRSLLEKHGAAFCLADSTQRQTPVWRTAPWGYLRMHEGRATPHPCYGRQALTHWAERLAQQWSADEDVYVFFNNDHRACAVRDSRVFANAAARAGLRPTRVPGARDVHLG